MRDLALIGALCGKQGVTTALAKAAKNIEATLICRSETEARRVYNEFKIKTVAIHGELTASSGPYLVDTEAIAYYADHMERQISRLKTEMMQVEFKTIRKCIAMLNSKGLRRSANHLKQFLTNNGGTV